VLKLPRKPTQFGIHMPMQALAVIDCTNNSSKSSILSAMQVGDDTEIASLVSPE
jgi:hypothetical protein